MKMSLPLNDGDNDDGCGAAGGGVRSEGFTPSLPTFHLQEWHLLALVFS